MAEPQNNIAATADEIGSLTGARTIAGSVSISSGDVFDYYRFTTTATSNFTLTLTGLAADADVTLYASDGLTPLGVSALAGTVSENISVDGLLAGTYYVRVNAFAGATDYVLSMSADSAGSDSGSARAIGPLGATSQTFTDFVGDQDTFDYYSFSVSRLSTLNVSLTGLSADADLFLVAPDGTTVLAVSNSGDAFPENIVQDNLAAGTYYLAVAQFSGNTNYSLTASATAVAPPDLAGNTTVAARGIGALVGTPQIFNDFVGTGDTNDYYTFTTSVVSSFSLTLSGLTADADVQLLNSSGGGIASSTRGGTQSEQITFPNLGAPDTFLAPGTYYVRVYQFAGDADYTLTLAAPPVAAADGAGNDTLPGSPHEIGVLGVQPQFFNDFVGDADPTDFYRFTTSTTSNVSANLAGLTADADVYLYGSDGSTILGLGALGGSASENFVVNELLAGTYFVEVRRFSGNTNYNLSLSAAPVTPPDLAGNVTGAAREIGILGATPQVFNDFVGAGDTDDFYRFTTSVDSTFSLTLTGIAPDADANVRLLNASGAEILPSNNGGSLDEQIALDLAPGTYFVHVFPFVGDTSYVLTLDAAATIGTDIAGNDPANALDVGALTTPPQTRQDFVGALDPDDFYRFTVTGPSNTVNLSLTGLAADADLYLLVDGPGGVTPLAVSALAGPASESITRSGLAAGDYLVLVNSFDGDTAYTLNLSATTAAPPDAAGNTLLAARNTGALGDVPVIFSDFVGAADTQDYYRFTTTGTSDITLALLGLTGDATLELRSATGQVLATGEPDVDFDSLIVSPGRAAGTYFVRVSSPLPANPANPDGTGYSLGMLAEPPAPSDPAGDTPATAFPVLVPPAARIEGFVGDQDFADYYRVDLTAVTGLPYNLTLNLTGLTSDADLFLFAADGVTEIGASLLGGPSAETIARTGLSAGTYYVLVEQFAGNTNYVLNISATNGTPPDLAGNTTVAARDIGALGNATQTFGDFVGTADTNDYYRFTTSITSDFSLALTGLTGNANVELLTSAGVRLGIGEQGDALPEAITRTGLAAGTYFVRVFPGAAGINTGYTLEMSAAAAGVGADGAGNVPGAARDIGALTPLQTFPDFVGDTDPNDYYRFTLGANGNLTVSLTGLTSDADLFLLGADGLTPIAFSVLGGSSSETITRTGLAAGTYYVQVAQFTGNTNYTLSLSATQGAPVDTAGNSTAAARDVGALGAVPKVFNEFVGAADTQDFYRFTVSATSELQLDLTGLSNSADVALLNSAGTVLRSSAVPGAPPSAVDKSIDVANLGAGTYYVRVTSPLAASPTSTAGTPYALTMSAIPIAPDDPAGETTAEAQNLGVVGPTTPPTQGFVGADDTRDYYRFDLAGSSNLALNLTGLSADADVFLYAGDGETLLGASTAGGSLAENITRAGLAAGTYYVLVEQFIGDTNYTLSLAATAAGVQDLAGNSTAAARNIGALNATPQTFTDFVGAADTQDFYRFTVPVASRFSVSLSGPTGNADVTLLSSAGTMIRPSAAPGTSNESFSNEPIAAGTYFVRVFTPPGGGDVAYSVTLSAAPDVPLGTADDDPAGATVVTGALGATVRTFQDFVGDADTTDYYRFTTSAAGNFNLTLTQLVADADVFLIAEDGFTILASSLAGGNQSEQISRPGLAAGTYYVRVEQFSGTTGYTLSLSAAPVADGAGNTPAAARLVGALGASEVSFTDAVGGADTSDYYRFTTTGTTNFRLSLDGLSDNLDVRLLRADTLAEVDSSLLAGTESESIVKNGLGAGAYLVQVLPATPGDSSGYTLRMSASPPGVNDDSRATANVIGALGAAIQTRTGFVGSGDPVDFYRFSTAATSNLRLTLSGLTADADVELLDANGVNIDTSAFGGNTAEAINFDGLAAGTYFVRVYPFAGNTNYTLGLRAEVPVVAPDGAGNTVTAARNIGTLGIAEQSFTDFVGASDAKDFYRFQTTAVSNFRLTLDGLSADADVRLWSSSAGGTALGTPIDDSAAAGIGIESIVVPALAAGTYYVEVFPFRGDTSYRVTLSAQAPSDPAGNTSGAAHGLGAVGAAAKSTTGFVGSEDPHDWYGFSTGATSNFRLNLSGLTADADVQVVAANGTTVLGSSAAFGNVAETIQLNGLQAGDYFVHVYQFSGNTNYNLQLTATPIADTAPNTAATGRLLTLSGTPISVTERVGEADALDWYRFTLTARSDVSFALGALTANADMELRAGANGVNVLASDIQAGTGNELIERTLNAGTYYIRVVPGGPGQNPDYTLTASAVPAAPADAAGNALNAARAITATATQQNFADFVGPADGNDYYRFTLAAASGLRVSLTGDVASADVRLLSASGTEVAASRSPVSAAESMEFDRLAAGTYYLRVFPDDVPAQPAFYSLGLRTVAADDFADTIATTGRVTANAAASAGGLQNAGDVDWFSVSLSRNVPYLVRLSGASSGAGTLSDPAIHGIFDFLGNPIDNTRNEDGNVFSQDSWLTFTPTADGTYYIAAGAGAAQTGTYRLQVTSNNQAPVVNAPVGNQTFVEGHGNMLILPWDVFTDVEGGNLSFEATDATGRGLPAWLTFDQESRSFIGTPPPGSGDVTIRVTARDAGGGGATTQFVVNTANAPADDFRANTATTGVVTAGGSARGRVEVRNDVDWHQVTLNAGTSYLVELNGVPGTGGLGDPFLRGIYNSRGAVIPGTSNDNAAGTTDSQKLFAPSATGTYFIAAGGYGAHTGSYTVSVTPTTNAAPTVFNAIPDRDFREGQVSRFQLAQNTFADTQTLTLRATQMSGAALPTWLGFNAATRTFSGTAPANSLDVGVRVTARDPGGLTVSDDFVIRTQSPGAGNAPVQNASWTVLVYMAADNNLEAAAIDDINEMELAGLSGTNVNVVVMVDRRPGFDATNGNWTDARRGRIGSDANATTITSTLTSIGEVNTGDPQVLTDFINWGTSNFRADRYALVVWDHGGGLDGTSYDTTTPGGDRMTVPELTQAIDRSNLDRFDIVGFDTCLQGMVEQVVDLRGVADIVIASEAEEPGDGWDYEGWLTSLQVTPNATPEALATAAVTTYQNFYLPTFDRFRTTLTAVRTRDLDANPATGAIDTLTTAINTFADTAIAQATDADWTAMRTARNNSISFNQREAYRDLGQFMLNVAGTGAITDSIQTAAGAVVTALDAATIARTSAAANATGLSIFLPGTPNAAAMATYDANNFRFVEESRWKDFVLAFNS